MSIVRVGGGYMTMTELLETVAPTEYERLSNFNRSCKEIRKRLEFIELGSHDAGKIVAKNIILNKILVGRCINPMERPKTQAYKLTRAQTMKPSVCDLSLWKDRDNQSPESHYSSRAHV